VKIALRIMCLFTVLATACLSLSLIILQPPRAKMQVWFPAAALLVAQGVLTLLATSWAGIGSLRWLVVAGGGAVALLGGSWVATTMSGPHFEGYAVLLGTALVVQGALTILLFLQPRAAGVHT